MATYASSPMEPTPPILQQQTCDDGADGNISSYATIIYQFLVGLLTFLSHTYIEWREFEHDLIVYSKSTTYKRMFSSFILILLFILSIALQWKLKIFSNK
jgi:hypothetical protein